MSRSGGVNGARAANGSESDGTAKQRPGWTGLRHGRKVPSDGFAGQCLQRRHALVRAHHERLMNMVAARPDEAPPGTRVFFDGLTGQSTIVAPGEEALLVASVRQMCAEGEAIDYRIEAVSRMPLSSGIEADGPLVLVHCKHDDCFSQEAQTAIIGTGDALLNVSLWLWMMERDGVAVDDEAQVPAPWVRCWDRRAQWARTVGASGAFSAERGRVLEEIREALDQGELAELRLDPLGLRCNHAECVTAGMDVFVFPKLWQGEAE